MIRVGLLWHSLSTGNLGVSALSISNMLLIADAAKEVDAAVEFVIFGPRAILTARPIPELPPWSYVEMSESLIRKGRLFHVKRALDACDLIFDIGSGDSFSDIYGAKRFLKISLSKLLIGNSRAKLILSPQTIGPFNHKLARSLARIVMRGTNQIFVRDVESFNLAAELLTSKATIRLGTDVAMRLPVRSELFNNMNLLSGDKFHVGINVSGLLWSGGYTGANQFGLAVKYPEAVKSLVLNILDKVNNVHIWLVPHVYAAAGNRSEDDRLASQELASTISDSRLSIAPQFADAIEAKSFIARMNFFYGSRMHSTIAAFSSGVPVIPLAYSKKFKGLFGSLGYPHCVDLREVHPDAFGSIALKKIEERAQIKNDIRASQQRAEHALESYRRYLLDRLRSAATK